MNKKTAIPKPIKGAGRCPRCASRKVERFELPVELHGVFYARTLETCGNCRCTWEPFDTTQIWDADDPLCSFRDPCDNCAFRPGSPEQRNIEEWKKLIASLKDGASFFCHKGVPINPASEDGFAYPRDKDGKVISRKMRVCRGYLNILASRFGSGNYDGHPDHRDHYE